MRRRTTHRLRPRANSNLLRPVEGRGRLRPPSPSNVGRSIARHRHSIAMRPESANFGPSENTLLVDRGSPNFAKACGPTAPGETGNGASISPSVGQVGEVKNLGAPFPTQKLRLGSASDRYHTKGPGRVSNLLKIEVDRPNSSGDTGFEFAQKC